MFVMDILAHNHVSMKSVHVRLIMILTIPHFVASKKRLFSRLIIYLTKYILEKLKYNKIILY
jgi:hypothetical protein